MLSESGKVLSLAALLSIVGGSALDLGNAKQRAFNAFFYPSKVERVGPNGGIRTLYAEGSDFPYNKDNTITDLTPKKLEEIIEDDKITFIYWRHERGDALGNRFFRDVLRDYGERFDSTIIVELSKYSKSDSSKFKKMLKEYNPSEKGPDAGVSFYSIAGFGIPGKGGEVTIRSPPIESKYEEDYGGRYKEGFNEYLPQFEMLKR